ncbi:MAG: hypothetical protein KJS92_01430 [Bacteroidetes bacterium]|nr:hypothetical protein [Bacteroidota bacterium]
MLRRKSLKFFARFASLHQHVISFFQGLRNTFCLNSERNINPSGLFLSATCSNRSYLLRLKTFVTLAIIACAFQPLPAQTTVQRTENGYMLMRNGSPYFVKGVGGTVQLDLAVSIGANSIRTWGLEQAQELLDQAHKHGLTVMLGFWLQHERHGFNYDDTAKVGRQYRHFCQAIMKFKDHPALLLWGIGNELDLNYSNPACWDAVQNLARFAHEVDPNHPTATVTAGLDSMDVQWILKKAPNIDILGINTYGDIAAVPLNIARFGWNGPYMITEWGPNGYWESPQTSWQAAIEQSSTEKKAVYLSRYRDYIAPNSSHCLGSYAFLWGAKQEYTETWFGLFDKNGQATEPIDALELLFRGMLPQHPAPGISALSILGFEKREAVLKAGNLYSAAVRAGIGSTEDMLEPDLDGRIRYSWKILAESTDKKSGGDAEQAAEEVRGFIRHAGSNSILFRAPERPGAYRLFARVELNGKTAYHNIPFLVQERSPQDGPARLIQVKPQSMRSFHEE